jgi:hypothetical protein
MILYTSFNKNYCPHHFITTITAPITATPTIAGIISEKTGLFHLLSAVKEYK